MPWPQWWSSTKKDDTSEKGAGERVKDSIDAALETGKSETVSIASKAASSKLSAFTQPQTLIATTVLTAGCLGLFRFYRSFLRRFPEAINIKPSFFRKRSIVGKVTSVGDGDNFRIFHTPGGRLAGWGWLRKIPDNAKDLRHRTVSTKSSTQELMLNEGRYISGLLALMHRRWLILEGQLSHMGRRLWTGSTTTY